MGKGPNILGGQTVPLVFPVGVPDGLGLPDNRLGDATRLYVRALAPMQMEGLVVSARTGLCWRMASDEGTALGGHDSAPFPPAYFMAGVAAGFMNEIEALAVERDIGIKGMRLVLDGTFSMTGSLLRRTKAAHVRGLTLRAQIDSAALPDLLYALVSDAVALSPFYDMIRRSREGVFSLTHNGRAIAPGRVKAMLDPAPDEPADPLNGIVPLAVPEERVGRFAHPLSQTEDSEQAAAGFVTDYGEDGSIVRVFCSKRGDGIKEIVQHLYNPTGTVYRLFSEEVVPGQAPRAPDAMSLVSAGIGFCFMTQLGRYADAIDMDLDRYTMVQDAPFAPGGATSGSRLSGQADPVSAHVYMHSDDDDDTARDVLGMAEQTCFLHAVGRDEVPIAVRVEQLQTMA